MVAALDEGALGLVRGGNVARGGGVAFRSQAGGVHDQLGGRELKAGGPALDRGLQALEGGALGAPRRAARTRCGGGRQGPGQKCAIA